MNNIDIIRKASRAAKSIPVDKVKKAAKETEKPIVELRKLGFLHSEKVESDYEDKVREVKTEKNQITKIEETGRFPTPANTKWQDVKMCLIDKDQFKITIKNIKREVHYSQMGFKHQTSPKSIKSWKTLLTLARKQEGLKHKDIKGILDKRQLSKRIEEINKKLQTFFGISEKPIPPYNSKNGYKPSFTIYDMSYLNEHEDSLSEDTDNDS